MSVLASVNLAVGRASCCLNSSYLLMRFRRSSVSDLAFMFVSGKLLMVAIIWVDGMTDL